MTNKYLIAFRMGENLNLPIAESTPEFAILSHFLMYWDNPTSIVSDLLPLINRGIEYGTSSRWKSYQEVPGLKEKMIERWSADGSVSDPATAWEQIRNWKGFYIEEEGEFLEGIGAGPIGFAFVMEDTTVLSDSDMHFKDLKLPSKDFKGIVEEWLQFILENKK